MSATFLLRLDSFGAGSFRNVRGGVDGIAMRRGHKRPTICVRCGNVFQAFVSAINQGRGRCCSLSCAAALASLNRDQRGSANNNWRGGLSDNTDRKRRYREANPDKHAAHQAVTRALKRGELERRPCAVCGSSSVEGHHHDYTRPLEVTWLCKRHHLDAHGGRLDNGL